MTLTRFLVVLCATLSLAFGSLAVAQGLDANDTGLTQAAQSGGYDVNQPCASEPGGCIPQVIGKVVSAMLGILGALFLALLIWGGAQYMLSQGNDEKVKAAKLTLTNAIIGMLVVAASYAIATFVLTAVGGAVGSTGATDVTPSR